MSASPVALFRAVTPAPVRRRVRGARPRGPQARPRGLAFPGRRPVQPASPSLSTGPVRLGLQHPVRPVASDEGVQLTDRGIAVVVALFGVIVVATLAVGLVKFFGVSNAPLDGGVAPAQAPAGVVLTTGR